MLRLSRGLLLCSPAARRCWAQDLMDLIGVVGDDIRFGVEELPFCSKRPRLVFLLQLLLPVIKLFQLYRPILACSGWSFARSRRHV